MGHSPRCYLLVGARARGSVGTDSAWPSARVKTGRQMRARSSRKARASDAPGRSSARRRRHGAALQTGALRGLCHAIRHTVCDQFGSQRCVAPVAATQGDGQAVDAATGAARRGGRALRSAAAKRIAVRRRRCSNELIVMPPNAASASAARLGTRGIAARTCGADLIDVYHGLVRKNVGQPVHDRFPR